MPAWQNSGGATLPYANGITVAGSFAPIASYYTWTGANADCLWYGGTTTANIGDYAYNANQRGVFVYGLPVYQYNKRKAPYLWRDIATTGVASQLNSVTSGTSPVPELFVDLDNMFAVRGTKNTTATPTTGACGTAFALAGGIFTGVANTWGGLNFPGQADSNVAPSFKYRIVDPYLLEETWPGSGSASSGNVIQWDYQIRNMEMLLDVVKPSSEDFLRFQQQYQSPSGIPYQYKRILYKQVIAQTPPSGLFQIPLNISVRSLSGIVIAIQDQYAVNPGQPSGTDFTKYTLPLVSSFMRRGLYRAEVVVGGQTYPVYQLLMQPPGPVGTNSWDFSHILESENFFGAGSSSLDQSFHPAGLDLTRNYLIAGTYGQTASQIYSWANQSSGTPYSTGFYGANAAPAMQDSSAFVLAISLSKDDVMNFATGIDSSQSGSITINLYFNNTTSTTGANIGQDSEAWMQRPMLFNIWSVCDAVFTLQNDAALVRY